MTDTLDHHDDDVRALVRASGVDADAAHVADLRARVLAAATGVGEPARPQRRGEPRRAAMALVGIAAAVVLVVTVALAGQDDPAEIATAPATTPATSATAPNESTAPSTTSTTPPSAPPTTGIPVTSTPPPTTPFASGAVLVAPDGEIRPGVDDLIATTTGGDLVWIRRDGEAVTEQTVLAGGLDAAGGDAVVGVLRGTVLYRSGEHLWAVSSPGATPVQVLDQWVNAAALSRDGSTLAVLSGVEAGQTLALYPTDGGPPTAGSGGEWRSIVWSPDGRSLYATSSDTGLTWISRIDVATGLSPAVTVELYRQPRHILGFDADGRPVTLQQGDEGSSPLMTLDPRTLQPIAGAWDRSFPDPMPLASLSPDGTRLALVDWATGDLTVVSLDGSTSSLATSVADAEFPIVAG